MPFWVPGWVLEKADVPFKPLEAAASQGRADIDIPSLCKEDLPKRTDSRRAAPGEKDEAVDSLIHNRS
jgi:hypothetical protein